MTQMQKYPIGVQSFSEVITGGYLYVDKTAWLYQLAKKGKYYFLSRPRRFGKSLLVSTLEALFEGKKKLFEGLWIAGKWDFTQTNPTVVVYFNAMQLKDNNLDLVLQETVQTEARRHEIELSEYAGIAFKSGLLFRELIQKLHAKTSRKVVVLIDEYDKPIIDFLDDLEKAEVNRNILRSFYGILKPSDEHLEFVLLTGVSKFTKVSVFSDLNNLNDISMDEDFNAMLGITQQELEAAFAEEIRAYSARHQLTQEEFLSKIKHWYNGYTWSGKETLYNPFSLLNFFSKYGDFQNFWFKTATPNFLINLIRKNPIYRLEEMRVGQAIFDGFDMQEPFDIRSLLFQTGYLTLKDYDPQFRLYTLGYPNQEVKDSMQEYLIGGFSSQSAAEVPHLAFLLKQAFDTADMAAVIEIMNQLLKGIPNQIFSQTEAFYDAIIHLMFNYLGIFMESEVNVSTVRADAIIQTDSHVFCLEFKLNQTAQTALRQIQEKGYLEKYASTKTRMAVGINFNANLRGIDDWQMVIL
jgi:hypothetical protein